MQAGDNRNPRLHETTHLLVSLATALRRAFGSSGRGGNDNVIQRKRLSCHLPASAMPMAVLRRMRGAGHCRIAINFERWWNGAVHERVCARKERLLHWCEGAFDWHACDDKTDGTAHGQKMERRSNDCENGGTSSHARFSNHSNAHPSPLNKSLMLALAPIGMKNQHAENDYHKNAQRNNH